MAGKLSTTPGLGLLIVSDASGNRARSVRRSTFGTTIPDAMSMRDAGWLQIVRRDKPGGAWTCISRRSDCRGIVDARHGCVDGFIPDARDGANRYSGVRGEVDAFLPPRSSWCRLSTPRANVDRRDGRARSIYRSALPAKHYKQTQALRLITDYARQFEKALAGTPAGSLRTYQRKTPRCLSWPWVRSAARSRDVIDEMRDEGTAIGILATIVSYRPFRPMNCKALAGAQGCRRRPSPRFGVGGPLANTVDMALRNLFDAMPAFSRRSLGGRPVTRPAPAPALPAGFRSRGRHASST